MRLWILWHNMNEKSSFPFILRLVKNSTVEFQTKDQISEREKMTCFRNHFLSVISDIICTAMAKKGRKNVLASKRLERCSLATFFHVNVLNRAQSRGRLPGDSLLGYLANHCTTPVKL